MNIIYKKILKGVEETALLSKGLALRLRTYLLLVDGTKSADEIISQHQALPEIEMVLKALCDEGYIVVVSESPSIRIATVNQNVIATHSLPAKEILPREIPPPVAQNSQQLNLAKNEMINEVNVLLGKDANLVIMKIQNAKTNDELFALLMGLKKIIGMYAGADKAEKFAIKFTHIATM